jgi:hypothetical protein
VLADIATTSSAKAKKPETSHLPFFFVEFFKSLSYFAHNLNARRMLILRPIAQGDFNADFFALCPRRVAGDFC